MDLKNYTVGLVLGRAGLNDNQIADIKARLKTIVTFVGAVTVLVPHMEREKKHDNLEGALKPLGRMASVLVVIDGSLRDVKACLTRFHDCDEIWCAYGHRQSRTTHSRAWAIYTASQLIPDQRTKYKLIPPWVEVKK